MRSKRCAPQERVSSYLFPWFALLAPLCSPAPVSALLARFAR
jgi:hypothetical protein